MSEAVAAPDVELSEQARRNPADMPLEQIDVSDPSLYESDRHWPFFARLRENVGPDVPRVYFSKGSAGQLPDLPEIDAEAISIDWRLELTRARAGLPGLRVTRAASGLALEGLTFFAATLRAQQSARCSAEGRATRILAPSSRSALLPC